MPLYRAVCTVVIGDGRMTSFWLDRWAGPTAFGDAFPALFSHATTPATSVFAVLHAGVGTALAPRLSAVVSRELVSLLDAVSTTALAPDVLVSRTLVHYHGPKGFFSFFALYKLRQFGGVRAPIANYIWGCHAPSKVHFFGWLLTHGRVQTRSSLLHKKILTPAEALYPICAEVEETADHLFAGCALAHGFWEVIGHGPVADADVRLFYSLPPPGGVPPKNAATFTLLCYWQLWKHRNGVVFRAQT
jgi:hypothetical protein